jgi:DNA (cytosine-5)-methyltransferase 1
MNVLDLFSGIGGMSLGLERAGMQTIGFCEIDKRARRVLQEHWPLVEIHEDITKRGFFRGEADIVVGGFPCQDVSNANALWGECAGVAGERSGLYRHLVRAVRLVRPRYAIMENVAALLGRGLGEVLGDLAEIGYDAEWHCVRACDIGFPHERDRIWIIAYPIGSRGQRLVTSKDFSPNGPRRWGGTEDLQLVSGTPFERGDRWPQPLIRRVDDGLPGRLDRLHGVGNAVVPAIAEIIGRAIMTALASQQLGQGE